MKRTQHLLNNNMSHTLLNSTKRLVRVLGLAAFLFLISCEEDPINVDDRTQWLGAWVCNETSGSSSPQSYSITVYEGTTLDEVTISGLHNEGATWTITANVYNRQLSIPTQTVSSLTISGSGSISTNGERVDLTFTFNDGAGPDDVIAYWTR